MSISSRNSLFTSSNAAKQRFMDIQMNLWERPFSFLAGNLINALAFIHLFSFAFVFYDISANDGCLLRWYAQNQKWRCLTERANKLSEVKIVIDELHMSGHVDEWCRQTCNLHKFKDLDKVILTLPPTWNCCIQLFTKM